MSRIIPIIILANLLFLKHSFSQPDAINYGCGLTTQAVSTTPFKPTRTPADNEYLKVLIVYITFADDNYQGFNNFWPPRQKPVSPNNNIPLIHDEEVSQTVPFMDRYPSYTYSDYFCEMSMGVLDFIGDEVLVNLPYSSVYYRDNIETGNRSKLNKYILQNFVDTMSNVNFADYDRWSFINEQWVQEADGNVEMIIMNYRYVPDNDGWFWDPGISGEASLGDNDFGTLFLDGKNINKDFARDGSGITALGQLLNFSGVTQIVEHEVSHHFFVNNLPWPFDPLHMSLGLMTPGVEETCFSMSPPERSLFTVGYIQPIVISEPYPPSIDYTLSDYISTGQVIKFVMPSTFGVHFWIANHQKVSVYDGISHGSNECYTINGGRQDPYCSVGKGLYIYREGCGRGFDIENADGVYDWRIKTTISIPPFGDLPIFEPITKNSQWGYNEFGKVINTTNGSGRQWLNINPCSDSRDEWFWNLDYWGDGLDAFNVGYDEIFSPYSNPNSNLCNSAQSTAITIRIISQEQNGDINIRIYFDDELALQECPPSRPKNLKVEALTFNQQTQAFHPKLTWDANIEPDFNPSGQPVPPARYIIYRGSSVNCETEPSYLSFATVQPNETEYIDESVTLYPDNSGSTTCEYERITYSYKISAIDYTNKESISSDRSLISGWQDPCQDNDNIYSGSEIPKEFLVYNYPNPFNPKTQIRYYLPKDEFVSIKIFNLLGEEISVILNNEFKAAGVYSIVFDGSNLASGVYFYRIKAGSFIENKKMVLIK